MIRLNLSLVLFIVIQSQVYSQRSLSEFENYFMLDLFELVKQNNMKEVVEKDSENQILRKWVFDETGKIVLEVDQRGVKFEMSIGEVVSHSSNTQKNIYNYIYNRTGEISKIVKEVISDGDTITMEMIYEMYGRDTIIVNSRINETIRVGEIEMEIDFLTTICSVKVDGKVDSISTSYFMNGELTSSQYSKYTYNESGNLENIDYTIDLGNNSDGFGIDEETNSFEGKKLLKYNSERRLISVISFELEELLFENELIYEPRSNKLIKIVSNNNSREPKEIVVELFYNKNDVLGKVIQNKKEFFYEIIKEKQGALSTKVE